MEIKINKPFAATSNVDEEDVRVLKRTLNWLGYYTPPEDIDLSIYPDRDIFKAIKNFQVD